MFSTMSVVARSPVATVTSVGAFAPTASTAPILARSRSGTYGRGREPEGLPPLPRRPDWSGRGCAAFQVAVQVLVVVLCLDLVGGGDALRQVDGVFGPVNQFLADTSHQIVRAISTPNTTIGV